MFNFLEDSDSDREVDITTNDNNYAKNYNIWRQKEELNKLKTKYGEDVFNKSDDSSSSSDDDDENAIQITKEVEIDFYKTLASLKTKDPKIYDENVTFFEENTDNNKKQTKKKDQPMYIKDYERKLLLKNSDDSKEELSEPSTIRSIEEEYKLKRSIRDCVDDEDEDDENSLGGILQKREKSDVEIKVEDEDYKQWLMGQKVKVEDNLKADLKPLKDYWNDPELDEREKFLRDYILKRRFLESEDNDYIPTYNEIIHDSDEGLSEDEKLIEKQEEFEHKYNFRFEEPDEVFIKRYPRTIESSMRRQDDRRKLKRAEVKERKQKEKQTKMEEIREMQKLKEKEVEEKIQKLKEITGNTEIAFNENDIEDDFDPESHDRRMQNLFSNEFYQGEEGDQKPEFPDIDEELDIENWEQYETQENDEETNEPHCDDENFNMDCEYEATTSKTSDEPKDKKKRRRKTKFAKLLSAPKPVFNPNEKSYQKYLDEHYKLECEDIIGDIACRFKYRKVTPNSFGLSIEEILVANDRELNKWCSLKKAVQYRPDNVEKYDVIAFEKKGQNETLKKKLLPSLFKEESSSKDNNVVSNESANKEISESTQSTKKERKSEKRKIEYVKNEKETKYKNEDGTLNNNNTTSPSKKKKKSKKKSNSNTPINPVLSESKNDKTANNQDNDNISEDNPKKARKRKNKNHNTDKPAKHARKDSDNSINISDARLKAFGIKPKQFRNKIKYANKKGTK